MMFISNAVVYFKRRKPIYNLQCVFFVDKGSVSSRNPFCLNSSIRNKTQKLSKPTNKNVYHPHNIFKTKPGRHAGKMHNVMFAHRQFVEYLVVKEKCNRYENIMIK